MNSEKPLHYEMMDNTKRERLEAEDWKVGSVAEFLQLTPEEAALIEIKLVLSKSLKERRQEQMTQAELAGRIKSSRCGHKALEERWREASQRWNER